MIKFLFLKSIILFTSYSYGYKASEIITEAQSSFLRGDYYNASRYYDLTYSKKPTLLKTTDIENYLITKYHLLEKQEFQNFCKKNSNTGSVKNDFLFYCGKVFMHLGDYVTSLEYLEKLPESLHRLEYHFVKASSYIKLNKGQQCLNEMKLSKNKITDKTSDRFKDAINVLTARCHLDQGQYQKALSNYQSLNVKSELYLKTLEEQAWAHFKVRNLIASREIMNILVNYLTSKDMVQSSFGADIYFRIRYLQAYIELITQNSDNAKILFSSLNAEIKAYKKNVLEKIKLPKSLEGQLKEIKSYAGLIEAKYNLIKKYRDFLQQWDDQQNITNFDKEIKTLIAINLEVDRVTKLSGNDFNTYKKNIRELQNKQAKLVLFNIQNYLVNTQRNIDSILFKSNMGQVENVWAERTEGKRTLAEVLDTYRAEVNQVESYLVK